MPFIRYCLLHRRWKHPLMTQRIADDCQPSRFGVAEFRADLRSSQSTSIPEPPQFQLRRQFHAGKHSMRMLKCRQRPDNNRLIALIVERLVKAHSQCGRKEIAQSHIQACFGTALLTSLRLNVSSHASPASPNAARCNCLRKSGLLPQPT